MSVNSKMTAIADLIRTLTGASGELTLDQMAQELTGANGDVTSALTALTEKGVDTTGAGLAEIAGLVESIQAGSAFTGTFTPASYTNVVSFGVPIPEDNFFVVVFAIGTITMTSSTGYSRLVYITNIDGIVSGESHYNSSSGATYPVGDSTSIKVAFDRNANTMTLNKTSGTSPVYFYGGQEYIWFMGALDI